MPTSATQQFQLVDAGGIPTDCLSWGVSPRTVWLANPYGDEMRRDVEMDAATGELSYSGLLSGTWLTVRALYAGEEWAETEVYVFDGSLDGFWTETARLDCATGDRIPLERPDVEELRFGGSDIDVTFTAFETYVDYWGRFRLEPDATNLHLGSLEIDVEGGNRVPAHLDLSGSYELEERRGGELILRDMWLYEGEPTACGHFFRRY